MKGPDRLYHLAEAVNLPSILARGLLSTERLADCLPPDERRVFLRTHRPAGVTLPDGTFIRDQKPMPPALLAPALRDGLTPADWYGLVNGFVFLWPDPARLDRLRHTYRDRALALLTFDARRLLADLGHAAFVSPINIGNARRRPAPRGHDTLVPWAAWSAHGWPRDASGKRRHGMPAEVMIRDRVPVAAPYLVDMAGPA